MIDWLLLNVQRAVFQLYSGREQVQQNIETIYRNELREGSTGSKMRSEKGQPGQRWGKRRVKRVKNVWLPLKKHEWMGRDENGIIYSAYNEPKCAFTKYKIEVFSVHVAWHSPNKLPSMVLAQTFRIIIWQPTPRGLNQGHVEQLCEFDPCKSSPVSIL